MAFMPHVCSRSPDCRWEGDNNKAGEPATCPWCESPVNHFSDEDQDDHSDGRKPRKEHFQ